MRKLSKVKWTWNHGKVFSEIEYDDGNKQIRTNNHPPPTKACHDVAHFICGFNGGLDWDYETKYNHIAEYNAVFVELLLTNFSHSYHNNYDIDLELIASRIDNHMKWFSEEYYFISRSHPSRKNYIQLKKNILSKLDSKIVCKYFLHFYHSWLVEEICESEKFIHSLFMDSSINCEFKSLYDYLENLKKLLAD